MYSRIAVIGAVGGMLAACSGEQSSSPFLVRDSAGVRIVESFEPTWDEGEGWRLSEEPVVAIGREDGPEEYSLYIVMGAFRLQDGSFVVANGGSDELRYYDSSGVFLYTVGQDGFGPGEFKIMSGVWLVADTLVIDDFGQDRVTVYAASGEYARTVMLHREARSNASAVGVFSDGSVLGSELVHDRPTVSEPGMVFERNYMVYRRYSSDGGVLDSLGVFFDGDGLSEIIETSRDATTGTAYQSSVMTEAPYGRQGTTVASGDFLYHGSSNSFEIQVFSKEGALERIVRSPIPNPPVTEMDKDRFRESWLEENGDWGRRRVLELEFPDTKPAYGTIKVDALENIWVAGFSHGHYDRSGVWTVFDADGVMLGKIEVPTGGRISQIGDDYVLGAWRNELDVEQVRMYRLIKN